VTIRNLDTADPQQLVAKWRIAHERAERLERDLGDLREELDLVSALLDRVGRNANRSERVLSQIRAAFEEDYIDVPDVGWVLRPRGLRRIAEILERTK
jgi:predicted  nucleic acid-binding Zn-ribbon protein